MKNIYKAQLCMNNPKFWRVFHNTKFGSAQQVRKDTINSQALKKIFKWNQSLKHYLKGLEYRKKHIKIIKVPWAILKLQKYFG